MINRLLTRTLRTTKRSVLLLGPRQAGKSTLVKSLSPDLSINLADQLTFFDITSNPNELRELIETKKPKSVFIDEIQKYAPLLNTVQALIDEKRGLKFYLTGSSARKLKRGRANLLPGRVLNHFLGPLVAAELSYKVSEESFLRFGSLPEVYLEKDERAKKALLRSYVSNYIQEEISAEAIVRNIDSFSRALPNVIQTSGLFIDYSKLAKIAKVSRHSLGRFYEIMEDTLIGHRLWPDQKLKETADLIKHPKFFIFDLGVYNSMNGSYELSEDRKGILFEHLICNQLFHSAWAREREIGIGTFRSRGGLEIDFILTLDGKRFAIEAKAQKEFQGSFLQPLERLKTTYEKTITPLGVHMGKLSKKINGIWCHPWQVLLKELGL